MSACIQVWMCVCVCECMCVCVCVCVCVIDQCKIIRRTKTQQEGVYVHVTSRLSLIWMGLKFIHLCLC